MKKQDPPPDWLDRIVYIGLAVAALLIFLAIIGYGAALTLPY